MTHLKTFKTSRMLGFPVAALMSLTLMACGGGIHRPCRDQRDLGVNPLG